MPLPGSLQAQWKAEGQSYSDNATMSSGFADSSGNSRTATLQNGTPKWRSGASGFGPNGKACVTFDGSSNFLVPNFLTGYTAGEIFVFMKADADPATGSPASPIGSWGTHGGIDHVTFTDGIIYDGWGATVRKTTINPQFPTSEWCLYSVRTNANFWLNTLDDNILLATLTNTVGFNSAALIGKSGANFFRGRVAEIQFYNAVLSASDRATVLADFETSYAKGIIVPTVYKAHWGEKVNVTVDDTTGSITKSSGTGGSYDASARVKQLWDNYRSGMQVYATVATNSTLAFGIYAHSTSYTKGAVTIASLLACWEVTGGNAIVKESNTTRFTQNTIAVNDVLGIILAPDGALLYTYNGTVVFVSAIAQSTVRGWKPWRVMATMSASSSQFTPVEIYGPASEYYDATQSTIKIFDIDDEIAFAIATPVKGVHIPEGGGEVVPISYAHIA